MAAAINAELKLMAFGNRFAYKIRAVLFSLIFCFIHPYLSCAQEETPLKDPIVIEVIQLDYADAEHLATVVTPLLSEEGRVVAYAPANALIIKDRASLVKKLIKIIKGNPASQPGR